MKRREFIQTTGGVLLAAGTLAGPASAGEAWPKGNFHISIAAWSWHRMIGEGKVKQLDMPRLVREAGAAGLELVNAFFPSPQHEYLMELKKTAEGEGIKILLIMCDGEGSMYSPDHRERHWAVVNHRKWLDIAAQLGCHSIRCNAGSGNVDPEEAMKCAADSFAELAGHARQYGLNVTIENHWGLSSNPRWLTGLMKMVDMDNFGTLPDFGNFPDDVDRYAAVEAMMPYAKAVSAKTYDFDEQGMETKIDYPRMIRIVLDAGYHGFLGVEYEGDRLSELDGIKASVALLKKFQA